MLPEPAAEKDSESRKWDEGKKLLEKQARKSLHKKKSQRDEDKDSAAAAGNRKEKDKKRDGKDKKVHKPSISPLDISRPIYVTASDASGLHKQSLPTIDVFPQQPRQKDQCETQQQPSVSTSKLFFPFFHKNLFAAKEKEVHIPISPAAERLQRTATVCSRASTLRRRVGKVRPESTGTMASDRGTIGSGIRDAEGQVPVALKKCIALVEEIGMVLRFAHATLLCSVS